MPGNRMVTSKDILFASNLPHMPKTFQIPRDNELYLKFVSSTVYILVFKTSTRYYRFNVRLTVIEVSNVFFIEKRKPRQEMVDETSLTSRKRS